eukprot:m.731814 g.731814  ORF g.731814 m.731814 type:complete len:1030 (-) comp23062_c1_seq8:283-3372(-)
MADTVASGREPPLKTRLKDGEARRPGRKSRTRLDSESSLSLANNHSNKEAILERHGFLVAELISTDGQLGPTLRAVYDSDSCVPEDFLQCLKDFVKRTDGDIERICNKYYKEFIESIGELLNVRSKAAGLNDLIRELNEQIVEASAPAVDAMERLYALRKTQRNILTVIEYITNALPVVQLYCKATSQLANRRFYPALKSLEELEVLYLKPPGMTYTFAETMRQRVPVLRAKVKQEAFDDLQAFLTNIRDNAARIGDSAMEHTVASDHGGTAQNRSKTNRLPSISDARGGLDEPPDVCVTDQADFNLLHRSLHIYEVLDCRTDGETYYKDERRKQAQLALEPLANMAAYNESYADCFHQLAGFFIVENTVLSTTTGLLSTQWVSDLWDTAVTELARVLQTHLAACNDVGTIRVIKNLIVHFSQTLQGYGYNCGRLYDVCVRSKDRYSAVLRMQCASKFRDAFLSDNYSQLQAANEQEYSAILAKFPFRDAVLEESPFPKVLPFSSMVPNIFAEIVAFIKSSVTYVEDLDLSQTEVDEAVRKSTNILLSKTLSGTMSDVIRRNTLTLQKLTQISVNTTCLQNACSELEAIISSITHSVGDDMHVSSLHGASAFKDARAAAEEKLFSVLHERIDDFLECSEFDWYPNTASDDNSEYLFDMLGYLTTVFASLSQMPPQAARTAYFGTCKYIADSLLKSIMDPTVQRINANALRGFGLDVEMCEEYAGGCPVAAQDGSDDSAMFTSLFARLRQLVDLVLEWDWVTYFDPAGRKSRYNEVPAYLALSVAERYDVAVPLSVSATKRARRKQEKKSKQAVGDVLKHLRELVQIEPPPPAADRLSATPYTQLPTAAPNTEVARATAPTSVGAGVTPTRARGSSGGGGGNGTRQEASTSGARQANGTSASRADRGVPSVSSPPAAPGRTGRTQPAPPTHAPLSRRGSRATESPQTPTEAPSSAVAAVGAGAERPARKHSAEGVRKLPAMPPGRPKAPARRTQPVPGATPPAAGAAPARPTPPTRGARKTSLRQKPAAK